MNEKVLLIVRDGWGYREETEKNFIKLTQTPNMDNLEKEYPTKIIGASGPFVGLPEGFMGNSEVGHLTLGAGQVIPQSLTRINQSIKNGEFLVDRKILKLIQNVKRHQSKLHLIILMQKAGVHSHLNHLFEMMKYAQKEGLKGDQVLLHLITDGRDEEVKKGIEFLKEVEKEMKKRKVGKIVTLSGRYWAMDRNNKWERTEKYYDAIVDGVGNIFGDPEKALIENYQKNITDEFIEPMVKEGFEGIQENDSIFFLNFRKDRPRQITKALIEPDFRAFNRKKVLNRIEFLSMTRYYKEQKTEVLFEDLIPENVLGEILERNNKTQARIAETEKFAHVTFFFDGGVKRDFKGKTEIIVPSPNVATYDLKPEMSAHETTNWAIYETQKGTDFILINYANPDMVGHTGNFEAIKKSVEVVDFEVGRLVKEALKNNYQIIITSDHGNVEDKREKTLTTHTTNPVPTTFILKDEILQKLNLNQIKGLADIKKVITEIMELS